MNPLALMAAISKSQRNGEHINRTSREMSVNTEMVRKVFFQNINDPSVGGNNDSLPSIQNKKVEEIQRMSGAQIHLPDNHQKNESNNGSTTTTMLTISGTEESILLAQFLVQSNIDMVNKQELQGKQEIRQQQRDFKGPEGFNFGPNFQPPPNPGPPFGHHGGVPFNGPGGPFMPHPSMLPPPLHQGGPLRPLMDQGGMPLPLMQQPIGPPIGPPHEGFGPMAFGVRGRGGIRGGPVIPGRGGPLRGGGKRGGRR